MSKTHTRPSKITTLSTGHFADAPQADESVALVGNEPSTAAQVTGTTAFDLIESLSSVGQITALRAIGNSAIISAVFAAHDMIVAADEDGDEEKQGAARRRMAQQAELASWATDEAATLAQSRFDVPMDLNAALDFACSTAAERQPDELPQEVLDALGITAAQMRLIDASEQKKAAVRSAKLRDSIRDNRDGIAAEVNSYLGTRLGDVVSTLTAEQHLAVLRKVVVKLQARMTQLLGMRARYSGALGEAMLLADDVKTADRAATAFARANAGELRDAA